MCSLEHLLVYGQGGGIRAYAHVINQWRMECNTFYINIDCTDIMNFSLEEGILPFFTVFFTVGIQLRMDLFQLRAKI